MDKLNILKIVSEWTESELELFKDDIDRLIKNKSGVVQIELPYNQYKGSGKCWIAEVDKNTKKILRFLNAESVIKDGHKGTKIFVVKDGYYYLCYEGSSSYDKREYIKISNGEQIEF